MDTIVAADSLATTLFAIFMMLCSIALVVLELHLPTHGILGIGGVGAFLLGSFLLLAPPEIAGPVLTVLAANSGVLLSIGGLFAGFGVVAMRAGLRARHLPVLDPVTSLPGALAVTASALAPTGTVLVRRERWSAVVDGEPVGPGEQVEVVAREGLLLRVRRTGPTVLRTFETLPSQGEVRPGVRVERTS
jgi:membrane-bound serine protease (ClpP class)